MKNKNRILLIVLLVLLSAFVLTKVFRTPALESNLDTEAFSLDTANIAAIRFHLPGSEPEEYILTKNDSSWTVTQGDQTAPARQFEVFTLLRTLHDLEPERMVSRKAEKWDDYKVRDSTAIRVTVFGDEEEQLAEWFVGRESGGMAYVRPSDQDVVYALAGNLRSRLGKDFDHWRDHTFLKVSKALVDKLTFRYPADSGFVLAKDGGAWRIDGQKADSATVENYLRKLQVKDLTEFEDAFEPSADPDATLLIAGGAQSSTLVKGWKDNRDWVLTSDVQDGVYFRDSVFVNELFRGKEWFLKGE